MADLITTAARFLAGKRAVATSLSSREIEEHVPRALRDSSVFSARTIYAEHVSETKREITALLDGKKSPAEIRAAMKLRLARLGYAPDPAQRGGLQDLSSDRRTNLIIEMQEQGARGYAVWRAQQDEALLTVWPAQELFRAEARMNPRRWRERWETARGELGETTTATAALSDAGPFVALKNDRVWTHPAVNRFGHPWTPFDYRSGMRLRQVRAGAARAAGALKGRNFPKPARDPMDGRVTSASAAGMDMEVVRAWAAAFGDRARVYAGRGGVPRVAVAPDAAAAKQVVEAALEGAEATAAFGFPPEAAVRAIGEALGRELRPETPMQVSASDVRHILKAHGGETRAGQRPVTAEDIGRVPETVRGAGRWQPAAPARSGGGETVMFVAEGGERVVFQLTDGKNDPRLKLKTMWAEKKKDRPAG